jgi:hypothetical protein
MIVRAAIMRICLPQLESTPHGVLFAPRLGSQPRGSARDADSPMVDTVRCEMP